MSTATFRAPRSRGMLSGLILVLLGLWGGLVPFVGPYWHFGFTPDQTWTTTSGRWWLEVLPAAVTVVGGLIVLTGANRVVASVGAFIAALAGAWFVVGGPLSMLWTDSGANAAGTPLGSAHRQIIELLTMFTGLGALIIFFAALALGRFMVVGAREVRRAEEAAAVPPEPVTEEPYEPLPQRTSLTRRQADSEAATPPETAPAQGSGLATPHERERARDGQAAPGAPAWDQQPPSVPADGRGAPAPEYAQTPPVTGRTSPGGPGSARGPEQAGWQERTPAGPPADRPWSGRATNPGNEPKAPKDES